MDWKGAISGKTKLVGIIGDPIVQTRSPAMHNAAFAALGMDWVYVPFHVRPADLGRAIQAVRALDLVGLNVTVPHKERAPRFLDDITPRARAIGAVNTVFRRHSQLIGDNTDGIGFTAALRESGCSVRGMRVVVVGAGGSAAAVTSGLAGARVRSILIVNRTIARARALARRFAGGRTQVAAAGLDALREAETVRTADLIVNATSVGLRGEPFPPLVYDATPPGCLFYDLIYGSVTDFLGGAKAAGRRQLDGLGMLLHQGAAAFRIWTGLDAPVDVMARALRSRQFTRSKSALDRKRRGMPVDRGR